MYRTTIVLGRPRFHSLALLSCAWILIVAACTGGTPIPAITSAPTVPSLPTLASEPTPDRSVLDLFPAAPEICERAFTGKTAEVSLPPEEWKFDRAYAGKLDQVVTQSGVHITSRSPDQVKSLACVNEIMYWVGYYSPGSQPAYQFLWQAHISSWPDGKHLSWADFTGGEPPKQMPSLGGAGYGTVPQAEFETWLLGQLSSSQ